MGFDPFRVAARDHARLPRRFRRRPREIGDLEPVDFRGISAAKRKPIRVVEGADVEPAGGPYPVALDRPRIERHCEMIEAETGRLAGTLLAKRLR